MLSSKEKKVITKRLHYLQGQLKGIERMVDEERPVQKVFNQLKAVEQGVHSTIYDVLEDQLKMHLAEVLSVRLAACPGNCSDAERLQYTKKQFSELDFKQIIQSIDWLNKREEKVKES